MFLLAWDWEFALTTQHTNAFPDLDRDLRFIPLGVEEPRVLTPTQVRRYNEVGHLFPIDIFSPGEIAEIRAYIDDLLPKALAAGRNSYEVVNWHKSCRGIWDIVTEPRIIDVVADLLGDSAILRHSHLFAELPGDAERAAWHQDASYWTLSPSRAVTAWPAIDDVDVDNSAMQVIPAPPAKQSPPPRTPPTPSETPPSAARCQRWEKAPRGRWGAARAAPR